MSDCRCDLVFQVEDSFIPNYAPSTTAGGDDFMAVPQYACLRCGKRWGYLGSGVRLIEPPKVLRIGR